MQLDDKSLDRRAVLKGAAVLGVGIGGISAVPKKAEAQKCGLVVDDSGGGDHTSIQNAVDAANPGATICVEPGTYKEKVKIGKSLTLIGDPGDSNPGVGNEAPVLDGEGDTQASGFSLVKGGSVADNVTIEGFIIKNYGQDPGAADKWGAGVKTGASSNVDVRNNEIKDIAGSGISIFNGGRFSPSGWTVENNVFRENASDAIHFANNVDSVIKNNIIYGGGSVPDTGSQLEQNESEPNMGIMLANSVRNGNSAEMRGITVADNTISGRFDNSGIFLLSINKNKNDSSTFARTRDIKIRNNIVSGLGTNFTNGVVCKAFRLGANPGANNEEVDISGVVYEDNIARDVYSGFTAGTSFEDGVTNVEYRNNTAKNLAGDGFAIGGNGDGHIREVLYENNEVENAGQNGLLIRANGSSTLTGITYRGTTVSNVTETGWRVKTRDTGSVSSVLFDDNKITGTSKSGVLLRPRSSGAITDITIKNSNLSENGRGIWATSKISDAFASILIEDTELRKNEVVGMLLNGGASGNPINLRQNNIVGNGEFGVKNGTESGGTITAKNNWWGAKNGPTREVVRSGRTVGDGDKVSGGVNFRRWLTNPS